MAVCTFIQTVCFRLLQPVEFDVARGGGVLQLSLETDYWRPRMWSTVQGHRSKSEGPAHITDIFVFEKCEGRTDGALRV